MPYPITQVVHNTHTQTHTLRETIHAPLHSEHPPLASSLHLLRTFGSFFRFVAPRVATVPCHGARGRKAPLGNTISLPPAPDEDGTTFRFNSTADVATRTASSSTPTMRTPAASSASRVSGRVWAMRFTWMTKGVTKGGRRGRGREGGVERAKKGYVRWWKQH